MKATPENLDHRIQIKEDEIKRYRASCINYPSGRMQKYAVPFLNKLQTELNILYSERSKIRNEQREELSRKTQSW